MIFGYNGHLRNMGKLCFGTFFLSLFEKFLVFEQKIMGVPKNLNFAFMFLKKKDQKGNLLKVRFNVFCIVQSSYLIKYQIRLA